MSIPGFVIRNALRNKRRLLLSVLSAAVSLFLLVTLMVLLRELTQPPTMRMLRCAWPCGTRFR